MRDTSQSEQLLMSRARGVVGGDVSEETVELLLEEYFKNYRYRKRLFGESYPFDIEDGVLVLNANCETVDIYTFFLLCGNLSFVAPANKSILSVDFERICSLSIAARFGDGAKVENIGTGRSKFSSDKRKMLRQLARYLKERIDERFFAPIKSGSGDHGVDLVCLVPLDRQGGGSVSALGQCAASSDDEYWKRKKSDLDKVLEVILFNHQPYKLLLIPVLYRSLDGSFEDETGLKNVILLDRLRLFRNDLPNLFDDVDYDITQIIKDEFIPAIFG